MVRKKILGNKISRKSGLGKMVGNGTELRAPECHIQEGVPGFSR